MPRIPVHRDPKPPPRLRNHDPENLRHSREPENQRNSRELDDFHHGQDHSQQNLSYTNGYTNGQTNGYANAHANGHTTNTNRSRNTARSPPKRKIGTFTGHVVAATGEFAGTFMFLYFSFLGQEMLVSQAAETSLGNGLASSQQNIFTALIYGFSLLVNVWAFYRISGGLFNPAVTLGMVISGTLPPIRGLFLFPAQLLAAISAAAVVQVMTPGDIGATNTTLSPGTSIAQGVFIEMFMTAELVFVVLMLAAEKSKDTFLAPIGIGLALFVSMLGGVYYTGGSLNPARSLGPAVASTKFPHYHWIYWVGPFLGALVASGYYRFVKFFDYEQVNPGQDSAGSSTDDD